jgi:hypothetical protein
MKRKFQKWCTPNGKNVVQYEIGHKDGKQWHGKSKHMDEVVLINESQNMELIMKEFNLTRIHLTTQMQLSTLMKINMDKITFIHVVEIHVHD